MRRLLISLAVLAALLTAAASAHGDGAGNNAPTRKLEAGFTVSLSARVGSRDGCYPAPPGLAKLIRKETGNRTAVAAKLGSTSELNVVYVVRKGSSCNGVRLALRHTSGLYLLDSVRGEVRVVGRAEAVRRASVVRQNRGPLRGLRFATGSFEIGVPNRRDRFDVRCPGKTFPLGGGVVSSPPIAADGEGFYPHSFERLGAQRGWHISGWLFDPAKDGAATRNVTLQVVCGLGLVPMSSPHRTTFTRPGETRTVVATCPSGQYLMSGGFQRTDFVRFGGNYVTESRALGGRAWSVTGHAYGAYGGELTAIAYCVKSKVPLVVEVSASTPLPFGASATATTPACPAGRRLTFGGFSAGGSQSTFFAGGSINVDGTWSASGYGYFGPAPSLTAYGYCLQAG